jgi:hypothetical protein
MLNVTAANLRYWTTTPVPKALGLISWPKLMSASVYELAAGDEL